MTKPLSVLRCQSCGAGQGEVYEDFVAYKRKGGEVRFPVKPGQVFETTCYSCEARGLFKRLESGEVVGVK